MPTPTPTTTATVATSTSSSSSRWCPTPEQLMILEEMYRAGMRTPNASQIQNITAHLLSYGKIEGKNVFYWFQNHKARDRQRLRRKLSKRLQLSHHLRPRRPRHQLCFQQSQNHAPLPHQPQQLQILNHQHGSINNCFFQYVSELSPQSHSSQSGRVSCCPSCLLQGGTMGAATSPRSVVSNIWQVKGAPGDDKVEADRMSVKRSIYGRSLDYMLAMDMSRSCLHYLPQPLKTLDLFPTAATNLREEYNLRQGA